MAHKTLTISEEAYEALASMKREGESFTKLILRITPRQSGKALVDYTRSRGPALDLTDAVERAYQERGKARLRGVQIE